MSALPQATNQNPPVIFKIGDKVKISASCPQIVGQMYYVDNSGAETYLSPPARETHGPTSGFVYTIIDKQELQRRKTSTGPTSAIAYEYRIATHVPHYTRKETVLKEKLKTLISQNNLARITNVPLNKGDTFKRQDTVKLTKDLKLEVVGMNGTHEYKVGQTMKVVGNPGSGKRIYIQGVTTAGNITYECQIAEIVPITGDTQWKSVEYYPVSALVRA